MQKKQMMMMMMMMMMMKKKKKKKKNWDMVWVGFELWWMWILLVFTNTYKGVRRGFSFFKKEEGRKEWDCDGCGI